MFEAIPGRSEARSLKRRGPASRASTISSVQRSPTRRTASCSGEPGGPAALAWRGSGMPSWYAAGPCDPLGRLVACYLQVSHPWMDRPADRPGDAKEAGMGALEELEQAVGQIAGQVGGSVVGIGRGWGRGSGVVVADGRVVTNAHNLRGDEVTVVFADGRSQVGQVQGVDVDGDLAVISVDTAGVTPITWTDAATPASVGTAVLAL